MEFFNLDDEIRLIPRRRRRHASQQHNPTIWTDVEIRVGTHTYYQSINPICVTVRGFQEMFTGHGHAYTIPQFREHEIELILRHDDIISSMVNGSLANTSDSPNIRPDRALIIIRQDDREICRAMHCILTAAELIGDVVNLNAKLTFRPSYITYGEPN